MQTKDAIVVLDFGSQYAHLIAKRLRSLGFYSLIASPDTNENDSIFFNAKGLIFSGGPSSIYDKDAPFFNKKILDLRLPILGLCYGHYVVQQGYGAKVQKAQIGEFGFAQLEIDKTKNCPLFLGIKEKQQVWMSHQDAVTQIAPGFEVTACTKDCFIAATQNLKLKRFTLQFHCEVKDTPQGEAILKNFALFCGMQKNWDSSKVLNMIIDDIKQKALDKNVLLFLSGGVDSSVTFALLNRALGKKRVLGLHIDNGFMRKDESKNIATTYKSLGFDNFIMEDASDTFLKAIEGKTDPQQKRLAVGETFIKVRDAVTAKLKLDENKWLLAQGTLYPDIIESGGTKNSAVIKTHHNRVAGIQKLIQKGLVIEPLAFLYKDEVRNIGRQLHLEAGLIHRHPFPGPGLSINVLCSNGKLTQKDIQEMDLAKKDLQAVTIKEFCLKCTMNMLRFVLPVRSVGVQGDYRTYRFPAVLSFANEGGGFYHIPKVWQKIENASSAITNASKNINRMILRLWQNPAVKDKDLVLQEGYCTKQRLDQLRLVDDIVLSNLKKANWYDKIFQHLTIDLPFASTPKRACFVLRPVCSEDVMTARFAHIDLELLHNIVCQIASLDFVDALYYDCTNKPPATFGWE